MSYTHVCLNCNSSYSNNKKSGTTKFCSKSCRDSANTREGATINDFLEYLVYQPNTGILAWKKKPTPSTQIREQVGYVGKQHGYRVFSFWGKEWRAHIVIWAIMTGELPPKGMDIDHINRIKDDNRWENLRCIPHYQNCQNVEMRGHNTSGYRGVHRGSNSNLWYVELKSNGVRYRPTKGFRTKEEAALEYNRLALLYQGKFAQLNDVKEIPQVYASTNGSKSGYKGVMNHRGIWVAYTVINHQKLEVRGFYTKEDAAYGYNLLVGGTKKPLNKLPEAYSKPKYVLTKVNSYLETRKN